MGIIDRKLLWLALSGTGAANLSGADALLDGEAQGLAFDFTDQSVRIIDTSTPSNSTRSTGIVNQGSLVGPSGKLTYTSPSNKLTLQSDGYYKYQAHNLYLNSAAPANQSITVISGASYAVTITGTVSVTASGAATGTWTAGTNTFTAATTTLTLGSTSGSGTVHVRRTPSNDDYIETAGAAKYALPLEYDTSGNCLGLLVEEARTNLALHSNTLNNATGGYTETGVSSSASSGSIFDGLSRHTLTASGSGAHALFRTVTLSAATTYTLSAILEPGAGVSAGIMIYDSTGGVGVIHKWNLSTEASLAAETLGAGLTVVGTGITDLGGGKKRVWSTVTTSANPTYNIYIYVLQADGTRSYTASGEAIIGHHFQLEAGSFPTSPILTYGAAATRNADPLSQLSTTFPLSATAGSLYAYVAPYAGSDLAGIVSLNDGTGNEEVVIYKDASANIVAQVEDGGVNQLAPLDSTVNASSGTAFKVALAWAADDFALSADGTAAQTDTGGTLPTVTTLEIGVDQANNYFNGYIKAISYVPRRKTDAELQTETT